MLFWCFFKCSMKDCFFFVVVLGKTLERTLGCLVGFRWLVYGSSQVFVYGFVYGVCIKLLRLSMVFLQVCPLAKSRILQTMGFFLLFFCSFPSLWRRTPQRLYVLFCRMGTIIMRQKCVFSYLLDQGLKYAQ